MHVLLPTGGRRPKAVGIWTEELVQLISDISESNLSEVASPYPPPNDVHGGGGYTWNLWTMDAWRAFVSAVYLTALNYYNELVIRWFKPLGPYLEISSMWPVALRIYLMFNKEFAGAPHISARFAPLSGGGSRVTMTNEQLSGMRTLTWKLRRKSA